MSTFWIGITQSAQKYSKVDCLKGNMTDWNSSFQAPKRETPFWSKCLQGSKLTRRGNAAKRSSIGGDDSVLTEKFCGRHSSRFRLTDRGSRADTGWRDSHDDVRALRVGGHLLWRIWTSVRTTNESLRADYFLFIHAEDCLF